MRHQLASIDLSDIDKLKERKLTTEELLNRAGDVETFHITHGEKVLKLFLQAQLEFIAKKSENNDQTQFGRGTFNGVMLVFQWMEREVQRSRSRFDKKPKPPTPENPFPEI